MLYLLNSKITNTVDEYKIPSTVSNDNGSIDLQYIYFGNTINNKIIENGKFTRLYYSTPMCSFNGLYIIMELDKTNSSLIDNIKNVYNNKFYIDTYKNRVLINKIKQMEENILLNWEIKNKTLTHHIYNGISKGFIKINASRSVDKIVLKISGVWENEKYFGLTYKYYNATNVAL